MRFDGDTLALLPTPFEALPVSAAARAVGIREFERPDGSIVRGNDYLYPEEYPRFGRLVVSRADELWVMAYPQLEEPIGSWRLANTYAFLAPADGAQWRVLAEDGLLLAEVRTPPGLFPLDIGDDYVLGVSKDELDVPTVSLHTLIR